MKDTNSNKKRLTISDSGLFISNIVNFFLILLITIVLTAGFFRIASSPKTIADFPFFPDLLLSMIAIFVFIWLDYLFLTYLIYCRTIFYDSDGLYTKSKKIVWNKIQSIKIYRGHLSMIKVMYKDMEKINKLYGIIGFYSSRSYIEKIKYIFEKENIKVS